MKKIKSKYALIGEDDISLYSSKPTFSPLFDKLIYDVSIEMNNGVLTILGNQRQYTCTIHKTLVSQISGTKPHKDSISMKPYWFWDYLLGIKRPCVSGWYRINKDKDFKMFTNKYTVYNRFE